MLLADEDESEENAAAYEEIEAKFRVTDAGQAQLLRTIPALADRYALGEVVDVVNVDTYYDAADLRLLRQGQTLRVRSAGDVVLLTAKSIGVHSPRGLHTRSETERQAPNLAADAQVLRPADLPGDVLAALGDLLASDTKLRPLVRLQQARAKRDVLSPDAANPAPVAEFSLDDVTVMRAVDDSSGDGWQVVSHFTTLEVELAPDADREALREIALWLRPWPGLQADDQNKLQQALLALRAADVAREAFDHRMHMAELCRRVWGEQLTIMLVNEAGVRFADDIEYVHDMRVATRRARAAGRLYAGYFDPRSRKIKRFMRRLRTTGRRLGSVRDLDVAIDKLRAFSDDGSSGSERKDTGALVENWTARRLRAHAKLVKWLDSRRFRKFVADFQKFCDRPGVDVAPFDPEPGEPPIPHQVRHVLPSLILARYEAIRAFEVLFEKARATGEQVPIETLHALRIECKYMRYHLEFTADLLGDEAAGLIGKLKGLQEHLGELNDASVAGSLVARAAVDAASEDVAEYAALQVTTQELLRSSLSTDLYQFLAEETRRTLVLALAGI